MSALGLGPEIDGRPSHDVEASSDYGLFHGNTLLSPRSLFNEVQQTIQLAAFGISPAV